MTDDEVGVFLSAPRGCVVAPAGCGKTELIARAAASPGAGVSLVLTHTHAGARALRDRLRKYGVKPSVCHVETIDGFSLRLAQAFPKLADYDLSNGAQPNWPQIHDAAARVLRRAAIGASLGDSYSALYVDEYQDCAPSQHDMIAELAAFLPCKVVGDELQAVFDFRRHPTVNWAADVFPFFPKLFELTIPYRWSAGNVPLGEWLLAIRPALANGGTIDLSSAPCDWHELDYRRLYTHCMAHARGSDGSTMVVLGQPKQCYDFAKHATAYACVEEIECKDLLSAAAKIQLAQGPALGLCLLDFANLCWTEASGQFRVLYNRCSNGRNPCDGRLLKDQVVALAIQQAATHPEPRLHLAALEAIQATCTGHLVRVEPWRDMKKALGLLAVQDAETLTEAVMKVRDHVRRFGRPLPRLSVARTLLIKGLECNHVVVVAPQDMTPKNLYVALTRGSSTLSVWCPEQTLTFRAATSIAPDPQAVLPI